MSLVAFRGEGLGYGARPVLHDVSFALSKGERVVLLGRSGSGKTTLLNAIHDRLEASPQRLALVPQDNALVPQLSVLRNALMGRLDDHGALYNLASLVRPRRADRAEIETILARLGLDEQVDRPVEALSGGQKQRTALARAFFRGGDVLIADEPVSAVDETQAAQVLELVRDAFETSVLALHDLALARSFGTRLVGLREGRIVFDTTPEALSPAQTDALYAA